jgi:hypothetical protein
MAEIIGDTRAGLDIKKRLIPFRCGEVIMHEMTTKRIGAFPRREISGCFLAGATLALFASPGTAEAQVFQNGGFVPMNQTNPSAVAWLQQGGNAAHDHNNVAESTITPMTISGLKPFGSRAALTAPCSPGHISTSPVVLNGTGYLNCAGTLATFSWPSGSLTPVTNATAAGSNVATPAIDPSRQYIYNVGGDGCVHKYPIDVSRSNQFEFKGAGGGTSTAGFATGCYSPTGGGWPEPFTANPASDAVVTALTIGNVPGSSSYLYVATDSQNDEGGVWVGSVTTINLDTGAQTVFNTLCGDVSSHIASGACQGGAKGGSSWSRGGIPYDFDSGRLFVGTSEVDGNIPAFTGNTPPYNWGESIVALNPAGGGPPVDWFSPLDGDPAGPTSAQSLSTSDDDGGSSNPLIIRLPASFGSVYSKLLAWVGKEGVVHLLNPLGMNPTTSYVGGVNTGQIRYYTVPYPHGNETMGEVTVPIAQWSSVDGAWIFVPLSNSVGVTGATVLMGLALVAPPLGVGSGQPFFTEGWATDPMKMGPGAWSGTFVADGILYAALNTASSAALYAFDPSTGNQLWSSVPFGPLPAPYDKRQTPLVVNGAVYYSGQAFTLGGTAPPVLTN